MSGGVNFFLFPDRQIKSLDENVEKSLQQSGDLESSIVNVILDLLGKPGPHPLPFPVSLLQQSEEMRKNGQIEIRVGSCSCFVRSDGLYRIAFYNPYSQRGEYMMYDNRSCQVLRNVINDETP
jgi:hypothetical protein